MCNCFTASFFNIPYCVIYGFRSVFLDAFSNQCMDLVTSCVGATLNEFSLEVMILMCNPDLISEV